MDQQARHDLARARFPRREHGRVRAHGALRHPADAIRDDEQFCAAAAEILGEFLVIHPFREGNARTIKLATDLLAAQTGRPLLAYDRSEEAVHTFVQAAKAAFKRQYAPLADIIRQSLVRGAEAPVISRSLRRISSEKGGEALDHAVSLRHVQYPVDPLGLVPKPRIGLLQRRSFSEVSHNTIVAFD